MPRPLEVSAEVGNPATRATDAHADDYDKREFVAGDVIRITDGTKSANYQRVVTGTTGTGNPQADKQRLPPPVVKRLRLRILRRSPGF
ncbi:hypothetical protein NXY01_15915 [Bacteroides fragilis]|nr:hypothetical protein NXY01_15915 [Bacteroides fragilis]